jgi:hypothetical protein
MNRPGGIERRWSEALELRRISRLEANLLRQAQPAAQLVPDRTVVLAQVDSRDPASGRRRKAAGRPSQTGPHVEHVGIGADIEKLDEFSGRRGPAKVKLVHGRKVVEVHGCGGFSDGLDPLNDALI